jgi:iron(III) transport system ATP-binding protein
MSFLSLNAISRTFGTTRAVADVSLDVKQGEFFGLLGPSGCGKTTTLRMIAGLEKPDAGSILFQDKDITNLPPERRGFGMVFQNYALFPHLNVFENVAFGLRARHKSKEEMNERVNSALDLVQLPNYGKRAIDQLSGGQQQRVAIARALVNDPLVLLADEPTGNLDSRSGTDILKLFDDLNKAGKTIIMVTHDQTVARHTKRAIRLRDGQVETDGAPA